MPKFIRRYVQIVDRVSRVTGRATMYMIFAMIGVLFYSSVSKTFFLPSLWTLEIAQFMMVAYFLLGGAYSMQLGSHVRMDLLYSSRKPRTRNWMDVCTTVFMMFYLLVLLYGSLSSTQYALEYGERSYSSWRPYMWPIKFVMVFGIILMVLQALAQFFKDLASAIGKPLS